MLNERLRNARKYLRLSQEYVAIQMKLPCPVINAIESGQRKVTTEELNLFSKLYGVSVDELMYGRKEEQFETEIFAELSDIDKREIMNLIEFKRKYKENING